jgi:hypothetical protein
MKKKILHGRYRLLTNSHKQDRNFDLSANAKTHRQGTCGVVSSVHFGVFNERSAFLLHEFQLFLPKTFQLNGSLIFYRINQHKSLIYRVYCQKMNVACRVQSSGKRGMWLFFIITEYLLKIHIIGQVIAFLTNIFARKALHGTAMGSRWTMVGGLSHLFFCKGTGIYTIILLPYSSWKDT